ncbi:MAG: hypothetical protein NTU79_09865 [Planctomycetota bacterium]|nr:hypothetical protein [Planctomycetota bacterium]
MLAGPGNPGSSGSGMGGMGGMGGMPSGSGMGGMPSGSGMGGMPSGSGYNSGLEGSGNSDYGYGSSGSGGMPGPGGAGGSDAYGYGAGGIAGGGMGAAGMGAGGYGAGGIARRAAPKKLTLKERATAAFQAGNTKRAYALLEASAIQASDEEASEILSHYRWAQHQARPQLGITIAVGATIKNPLNVPDLAPIGSGAANQNQGGYGGMEGMAGPGGSDASAGKKKSFAEVSGSFGKQLVQAVSDKHGEGLWTDAFREVTLGRPRNPVGNGDAGGYGTSGYGTSGYGAGGEGDGYGGNSGGPGLNNPGGMSLKFFQGPGKFGAFGGQDGGQSGSSEQPGMGPGGMGAPGMGPGGMGAPGMGQGGMPGFGADFKLPAGSTPIGPGMTYIGVDESSKLIKKAGQEGYDCLMIFELEIGFNRMLSKANNDTRIKVLVPNEVVKDTEGVFSSKKLNNIAALKAKNGGQSDGVDDVVELVVKKTVEKFGLQEIPSTLTLAEVKKSIAILIDDKDRPVMERLSEINFYYARGYIDENEKAAAFERIDEKLGSTLATGTSSEKLAAIEKLLERDAK